MKKFKDYINTLNENNSSFSIRDSWRELFKRQTDTLQFWINLFGADSKSMLLDRSDASAICKKAQLDLYKQIIHDLENKVNDEILEKIKNDLEALEQEDISAIGLRGYGK